AVAAVLWPARGLHIGRAPGLGSERAQSGGRMQRAGADLDIVRLQNGAALRRPVSLERQDHVLETARSFVGGHGGRLTAPARLIKVAAGRPTGKVRKPQRRRSQ